MVFVFLAGLAVLGLGRVLHWSARLQLLLMAVLYLGVLLVYLALPDMAAARLGGSLFGWLFLGAGTGVAWAYIWVVQTLKKRAVSEQVPNDDGGFSVTELDRYARHIVLRELGGPGQKRLKQARVLVIGAGGLGAPALQYLAAAGVGTIGVIDGDVVDNSNLQRQVIHKDAAIGTPKVFSAQAEMLAQNPNVVVKPYHRRLDQDMAADLFAEYDLILDGCDNFETRYLVNRTCVRLGLPLIAAALSQWEGQISTYHPASGGPCYACLYPDPPAPGLAPSCAEGGVLGPLPGVVGAMMAVEAIKHITGAGEGLVGRMMVYDALYGENRVVKVKRRGDCKTCS